MSDDIVSTVSNTLDEGLCDYSTSQDRIDFIFDAFETYGIIDEYKPIDLKNNYVNLTIKGCSMSLKIYNNKIEESHYGQMYENDDDPYLDQRLHKYIIKEFNDYKSHMKHKKHKHKNDTKSNIKNNELKNTITEVKTIAYLMDMDCDTNPILYDLLYNMFKYIKYDENETLNGEDKFK
jgi:hypothetical protein